MKCGTFVQSSTSSHTNSKNNNRKKTEDSSASKLGKRKECTNYRSHDKL